MSFDAFLITNVIEGRLPELISKYGPNWYANNTKEAFRTCVREEVQKEIVPHAPSALTVIMGLERVGITMPPLSAEK